MHAFDGEEKSSPFFVLFCISLYLYISSVYFRDVLFKLSVSKKIVERSILMKRKGTVVIMIMLLVFGSIAFTGCGRNDGTDDLSQTPNNAEDNLNDGLNHDKTDDSIGEDIRDDADDLGDDIRDGADDLKNGAERALDGRDNTNGKNNMLS